MSTLEPLKILIIDDMPEIHESFLKILNPKISAEKTALNELESTLFDKQEDSNVMASFHITSALQGKEGFEEIKHGIATNHPYALAFVDVRMPPGWDGIETIKRIWEVDPTIQIVICTAHSDYSWEETIAQLGEKDNLLILKKPIDAIAIRQLACALTKKWLLTKEAGENMQLLEKRVSERTQSLETSLSVTRGTLESSPDAILVIDHENNLIDYNNNLGKFWHIPPEILKKKQTEEILKFIAKRLEEPDIFLKFMKKVKDESQTKKITNLKIFSDRVFEVNQQAYKLGEEHVGHIYSFRDITTRAAMEEKIQYQATHDPLTKLANRVLLLDRLQYAINQAKRESTQFGVLFFDLNRFKLINDSLGHSAGDALLIGVAERLQSQLRKTDTLARIGGDEFVIVTSPFCTTDITHLVEKVLEKFNTPFVIQNTELYVTTSVGVAIYPRDGETAEQLLNKADAAMYNAKEIGGNRASFCTLKNPQENSLLQFDFHSALKNREFFLTYQPQFDMEHKRLKAIEVLIRWKHPKRGILLPIDFIELAEETGFILKLGEWILREACMQNKKWQDAGLPKVVIAVNMGTKQLRQPELVAYVEKILEETKLDPKYLEIELTENAFINLVQTENEIERLQKLGISIALDDFGAGYSSLNYLRRIKINKLKIDKSFIDSISFDRRDEQIIEAIISMASVLGFDVVAEGVETQKQINFLKAKHCEEIQGFFYSKPLTEEKMKILLFNDKPNVE
ncbi:MAG: EAL domain-containing protein [Legionella longbeachae]|nr:EAL domain-containing protein [Legionella longbeachae]